MLLLHILQSLLFLGQTLQYLQPQYRYYWYTIGESAIIFVKLMYKNCIGPQNKIKKTTVTVVIDNIFLYEQWPNFH